MPNFLIFNGGGDHKTELELVDESRTTLFRGQVLTSDSRPPGELRGTPQWITHIFASDKESSQDAFKEAVAAAKKFLGTDQNPFRAFGSSTCGRDAIVHVIRGGVEQEPEVYEVTRAAVDPTQVAEEGRPLIVGAKAWKAQHQMTKLEVQDFDSISAILCAIGGVEHKALVRS